MAGLVMPLGVSDRRERAGSSELRPTYWMLSRSTLRWRLAPPLPRPLPPFPRPDIVVVVVVGGGGGRRGGSRSWWWWWSWWWW
jgi:hypothetical protein